MEADINEPKSKSFNIYLRWLQLGFQLALAYWVLFFHPMEACSSSYPTYIQYISYAIAALSFICLLVIGCSHKFPRPFFFLTFIVMVLLGLGAIGMMVMG